MLKYCVTRTLVGIFAVSISLSLSNFYKHLEPSKEPTDVGVHDDSSRRSRLLQIPGNEAFALDVTDSPGRKVERVNRRALKSSSEKKTASKSRHNDTSNNTEDQGAKEEYIHQDDQGGEHETNKGPGEVAEYSSKGKSPRDRGKGSKGRSKGKKPKKESKDPKKSLSKLKTEMRRVPPYTRAPTPPPTIGWISRKIQVPEFTLSFGAPQAEKEPLIEEYSAITARTIDFFNAYLSNYFRGTNDTFASIDLENIGRRFRDEEPSQFNILMSFNAEVTYSRSQNPPTAHQHFVILRDAISPKYILDYVRPVGGTFASVDMVVLGPIIATVASP